jgi:cellobiose phosphorylase
MSATDYGEFSPDGRQYVIHTHRPPRGWLNYLWNEHYLAICSQTADGRGLYQDTGGRRTDLVSGARRVYLLDIDNGEYWTIGASRPEDGPDDFACTVGLGYQVIRSTQYGIAASWRLFVPRDDPCELWTVELTNSGDAPRKLKVVPYFDTGIHGAHEGSFPAAQARYHQDLRAVKGTNVVRFGAWYSHETVGRTVDGFLTTDAEPTGWDARRAAFVGTYGDLRSPAALTAGGCTGSACEFDPICFALETTVTLEPGESRTVHALAGPQRDDADIRALRKRYFARGAPDAELRRTVEDFAAAAGGVEIRTPDDTLNTFVNHWLGHQLLFNATWARVYFNGFRDLLQDADNLSILNPAHARETLRKVLTRQYASGYAPRAWVEGQLVEQDYSDSPVWIPFTVTSIVRETGDASLLDEPVTFWDGEPASVYEHCRRAMDYLYNDLGPRGLSRIHSGDWNDIMNAVGAGGEGESVWLSMALCAALRRFAELADTKGESVDAATARDRADELAAAVNEHGWDGAYYRRAYTDAGEPVGSAECDEGRCFLNPQSWSVLSDVADAERARSAMAAVDENLEIDIGVLTVHPPFTRFRPDVGFLSATRPGTNVNGGVYVHAVTFKVLADLQLGRIDAAWRTLRKVLPFSEARGRDIGEPYVVPNAYFAPPTGERYGEPGDGWFTGSAGWMLRCVVEGFFGVRPTREGLQFRPHIPSAWGDCEIVRPFRGARVHVRYRVQGCGPWTKVSGVTVNGSALEGDVLRCRDGESYEVELGVTA